LIEKNGRSEPAWGLINIQLNSSGHRITKFILLELELLKCRIEEQRENLKFIMDALKTLLQYPIIGLLQYTRFTLSSLFILPLISCNYMLIGKKSLHNFEIFKLCNKFSYLGGKYFFSGLVTFFAAYTASISAYVDDLSNNQSIIILYDYPWLRNPFSSIHAIALANLGEYASGIVLVSQLQQKKDIRGVPIKITTEYYKKARGTLKAISYGTNLSDITKKCEIILLTDIYDSKNILVAKTFVTWSMEPKVNTNNNYLKAGGGTIPIDKKKK